MREGEDRPCNTLSTFRPLHVASNTILTPNRQFYDRGGWGKVGHEIAPFTNLCLMRLFVEIQSRNLTGV